MTTDTDLLPTFTPPRPAGGVGVLFTPRLSTGRRLSLTISEADSERFVAVRWTSEAIEVTDLGTGVAYLVRWTSCELDPSGSCDALAELISEEAP